MLGIRMGIDRVSGRCVCGGGGGADSGCDWGETLPLKGVWEGSRK